MPGKGIRTGIQQVWAAWTANWTANWAAKLRMVSLACLTSLLLVGCVDYQVGVTFDHQTHGTITQQVRISDQLRAFSSTATEEWLDSITQRARQLGGYTKRSSLKEAVVTIPFYNGKDLEKKLNQFFSAAAQDQVPAEDEAPQFTARVNVTQNNLLLMLRNRLSYDLDLRSLALLSEEGSLLVNPATLLDLQFRLNTPWGARSITADPNSLQPEVAKGGKQLVWTLQPGEINHLEAVFWIPSPIGWGTLAIALIVAGGVWFQSKRSPA